MGKKPVEQKSGVDLFLGNFAQKIIIAWKTLGNKLNKKQNVVVSS